MDRAAYAALLVQARRLSRNADEAADLVQETLLAAVEQHRPGEGDEAWLASVLRRQAALRARGEMRRRARERIAQAHAPAQPGPDEALAATTAPRTFLQALPPASRRVAVLVLHGLDAAEIRWILGLEAPAFRQRLVRLRRALAGLAPVLGEEVLEAARRGPVRMDGLDLGRLRRLLLAALRGPGLGTHDPDGHLLLVARRGHA